MYSVETDARISQLRAISQERALTREEQQEAVRIIREGRVSASYASEKAKTAKAAATIKPDGAAVLANLRAMLKGP